MKKNGLLFLICVLLGGTGWIFVPLFNSQASPEVSLFHRFFLAGLFLVLLHFAMGEKKSVPFKDILKDYKVYVISGAFLYSFNYYLTYKAVNYLPSGLVSATVALVCFPNMLFGYLFLKKIPTLRSFITAIILCFGIYLLYFGRTSYEAEELTLWGFGLCIAGTFVSSIAHICVLQKMSGKNDLISIGISMLVGAGLSGLFGVVWGKNLFPSVDAYYVLSLFYIAFATATAFVVYFKLMVSVGHVRAAFVWIFAPVLALCLSSIFEAYTLNAFAQLGVLLLIIGGLIDIKALDRVKKGYFWLNRVFLKKEGALKK